LVGVVVDLALSQYCLGEVTDGGFVTTRDFGCILVPDRLDDFTFDTRVIVDTTVAETKEEPHAHNREIPFHIQHGRRPG
jgi:hypothetical protein